MVGEREKGRDHWMIYRGLGFLTVVWFGSSPPPPTSLPSVSCRHGGRLRKRDSFVTGDGGGEGVGEKPNHQITRRPESLILYTLWEKGNFSSVNLATLLAETRELPAEVSLNFSKATLRLTCRRNFKLRQINLETVCHKIIKRKNITYFEKTTSSSNPGVSGWIGRKPGLLG